MNSYNTLNYKLNPTECRDSYWLYCYDQNIAKNYYHFDGKWMMFFPLGTLLDHYWKQACYLYSMGKLTGINSMKVSTSKRNPLAIYEQGMGIIIFYCGPSEDQSNIMQYGANILNLIYYNEEYFYYKSDKNYLINHNKAYKHLYFINTINYYNYIKIRDNENYQVERSKNYNSIVPKKFTTHFRQEDVEHESTTDYEDEINFYNRPKLSYHRSRSRTISRSSSTGPKDLTYNDVFLDDSKTSRFQTPLRNSSRDSRQSRNRSISNRSHVSRSKSKNGDTQSKILNNHMQINETNSLNYSNNFYEFNPVRDYKQHLSLKLKPSRSRKMLNENYDRHSRFTPEKINYNSSPISVNRQRISNKNKPNVISDTTLPKKMYQIFEMAKNKFYLKSKK